MYKMWLRFIFTTLIFTIVVLNPVVEAENEKLNGIDMKKAVVKIIDQNEEKGEIPQGQSTAVQKPQIVIQPQQQQQQQQEQHQQQPPKQQQKQQLRPYLIKLKVEEEDESEEDESSEDDDQPPWLRHPVDQEDESEEEEDDEDFVPKKRKKIPGTPLIKEVIKVTRRKKIGVKNPEIQEMIVPGYVTSYGEVLVPLDSVSNGNGHESVSVINEDTGFHDKVVGLDGEGTWERKKKNRLKKKKDQENYEVPYPLQYYVEENYFKKRGKDKFGYVGSEVPYPLAYYIGQHKRHYIRKWHSGYKIPSTLFLRSGLITPEEIENESTQYFSNAPFESPMVQTYPQFYRPNPYPYYEIEEDFAGKPLY